MGQGVPHKVHVSLPNRCIFASFTDYFFGSVPMRILFLLAFALSVLHSFAQRTDTVRMMHYNLLQYGNAPCLAQSAKDRFLQTIFSAYKPDLLTVNEMRNIDAMVQGLKTNTLTYNAAMTPTAYSNSTNSELINVLYYNADKFGYLGATAIKGNVRDIDVHRLYYKAATLGADTTDLYCIIAHFKASPGEENVTARAEAAKDIVNWLRLNPKVQRYILSGDLNIYTHTEAAWQTLIGGTAPRFKDPINKVAGWRGVSNARFHTQSPSDGTNTCGAEGGLDDRFDFILTSPLLGDTVQTPRVLPSTYRSYGNDGSTYNVSLDCARNRAVSAVVCDALRKVSDHLPVAVSFLFPLRRAIAGTATYDLIVLNNPSPDAVRFRLERAKAGPLFWEVWDVLGRKVGGGQGSLKSANDTFETALPDVPNGLYWLNVRHEQGYATVGVVIAR